MLGQQEFEDVLAGLPDAFGRGPDDHALPDLVEQASSSFGRPSISTRHIRQLPSSSKAG